VFSINFVLITADDLWALRYPATHELFVLERAAGGTNRARHLEHASARGTIRVRAGHLAHTPAVVVATEPMDEDPGWRALEPGELMHVDRDLNVVVTRPLEQAPAHPLSLADLDPLAAASQAPAPPPK
jgi:predicted glutamine amidotransferase